MIRSRVARAACTVVPTVAIGYITNLITAQWDWTLAVALSTLVLALVIVQATSDKIENAGHLHGVPADDPKEMVVPFAAAIRKRAKVEEDRRNLQDSVQMPVRWHQAEKRLADNWSSICRSLVGLHDTNPPDLSGQLDQIVEIYRMVPSERLVVLGAPGSGKTFLAARFVRDMLHSDSSCARVPVIFLLRSWDPRNTTLDEWLADQLIRDYYISEDLARNLIDNEKVLPVLDGFDEVSTNLRTLVLQSLSRTMIPLLLTSRYEDYKAVVEETNVLRRAAVIVLDNLLPVEVTAFLHLTSRRGTSIWDTVLSRMHDEHDKKSGQALREVLPIPLMLCLVRAIYCDSLRRDPRDLLRYDSKVALEGHLLTEFLDTVYPDVLTRQPARDRTGPAAEVARRWRQLRGAPSQRHWERIHAKKWLGFLARSFPEQTPTEETATNNTTPAKKRTLAEDTITWWKLSEVVPWHERLIVFFMVSGLTSGLAGWLLFGPVFGLGSGLVCGVVGGSFCRARPFVPLKVQPRIRGREKNILWKFGVGLLFGLTSALVGWPLVDRWGWLALGLAGAVGGGLAGGVGGWLRRGELETVLPLHQEIIRGSTGGLAGGLVVGLLGWIAEVPQGEYAVWLTLGLLFGAAFGLADAFNAPIDIDATASPSVLLATNRAFTVFYSLMLGLAYGLVFGHMFGLKAGIGSGLAIGAASAVGINSWGRWLVISRVWLPLTGRLPWAVMAFLNDATDREVLRQVGASWQFRHELLRSSLLSETAIPTRGRPHTGDAAQGL